MDGGEHSDSPLEVGEPVRLDEVGDRAQARTRRVCRIEALHHKRKAGVAGAKPFGGLNRLGPNGLEHERVDRGKLCARAKRRRHRLVSERSDDGLEHLADIAVGLENEDPRHGLKP
jgi:hypothetical protein